MKKFIFTLEKLRDYRQQLLDEKKNTLSRLRAELTQLNDELDGIYVTIDQKQDELRELYQSGVSPAEISMRKRFISVKQSEAMQKKRQIAAKEKETERQLQLVVEATKDVKTLDRLEEVQLEEYKIAEQKENEQFIEEFVSNNAIRSKE